MVDLQGVDCLLIITGPLATKAKIVYCACYTVLTKSMYFVDTPLWKEEVKRNNVENPSEHKKNPLPHCLEDSFQKGPTAAPVFVFCSGFQNTTWFSTTKLQVGKFGDSQFIMIASWLQNLFIYQFNGILYINTIRQKYLILITVYKTTIHLRTEKSYYVYILKYRNGSTAQPSLIHRL